MNWLNAFDPLSWLTAYQPLVSLAAAGLGLMGCALALACLRGNRRAARRYRHLLAGPTGVDLDSALVQQADRINSLSKAVADVGQRGRALEEASRTHLQHIGVVRYNAFDDVGSDLSFSIAIVDGEGDGLVISSLYGRDESRAYAKPVRRGESTYPLSPEERRAIAGALERQAHR